MSNENRNRQRAQLAERMRERNRTEPQVPCKCGCGVLIDRWRLDGGERGYLNGHGHRARKPEGERGPNVWKPPKFNIWAPAFRARGACAGHPDPDMFFQLDRLPEVRKVCRNCPVMWECLQWGVRYEGEGVWGGMTPKQRTALRTQMRRASRARGVVPTVTER